MEGLRRQFSTGSLSTGMRGFLTCAVVSLFRVLPVKQSTFDTIFTALINNILSSTDFEMSKGFTGSGKFLIKHHFYLYVYYSMGIL